MSTLNVNNIEERTAGSGVSFNDKVVLNENIKLRNVSTSAMNALTGMAEGDAVYNTNEGTIYIYNGSSWVAMSPNTFSFDLQYLIIGGGAGGGSQHGGGGGAGGYINSYSTESSGDNTATASTITVTSGTSYTVEIGAGGAAQNGGGTSEFASNGNSGNDTIFGSYTAIGGGAGGNWQNHVGVNGGCGGGGATHNGSGGTGSQGGNGGTGSNVTLHYAGGGGGAGANGVTGVNGKAGNGGDGLSSSITGTPTVRAGGGGGGVYTSSAGNSAWRGLGGDGGGGDGAVNNGGQNEFLSATSGTENTGSGGGGSSTYASGFYTGAGGKGIVILRYPDSFSITYSNGLTVTNGGEQSVGSSEKYIEILSGTGTVYWS